MKLLILSDSHGDVFSCEEALRCHRDADWVIHLGDGEDDLDRVNMIYLNKRIARVKGNCSWGSTLREEQILELDGKRIFLCHGHRYTVKSTTDLLMAKAIAENCEIALYGHTHRQAYLYLENIPLHLCNPGSIHGGYYGLLHIEGNRINFEKKSLFDEKI